MAPTVVPTSPDRPPGHRRDSGHGETEAPPSAEVRANCARIFCDDRDVGHGLHLSTPSCRLRGIARLEAACSLDDVVRTVATAPPGRRVVSGGENVQLPFPRRPNLLGASISNVVSGSALAIFSLLTQ